MATRHNPNPGSWTPERIERFRALWAEGGSASQIARALGGITRNAVIGKAHRLGLTNNSRLTPASPSARLTRPRVKAAPAPAKLAAPQRTKRPGAACDPPPDAAMPRLRTVQTPGRFLCLADIGPSMCRYIEGDPGAGQMDRALMCAADSGCETYCPAHLGLTRSAISTNKVRTDAAAKFWASASGGPVWGKGRGGAYAE